MSINLGRTQYSPKGNFNMGETYHPFDIVNKDGDSLIVNKSLANVSEVETKHINVLDGSVVTDYLSSVGMTLSPVINDVTDVIVINLTGIEDYVNNSSNILNGVVVVLHDSEGNLEITPSLTMDGVIEVSGTTNQVLLEKLQDITERNIQSDTVSLEFGLYGSMKDSSNDRLIEKIATVGSTLLNNCAIVPTLKSGIDYSKTFINDSNIISDFTNKITCINSTMELGITKVDLHYSIAINEGTQVYSSHVIENIAVNDVVDTEKLNITFLDDVSTLPGSTVFKVIMKYKINYSNNVQKFSSEVILNNVHKPTVTVDDPAGRKVEGLEVDYYTHSMPEDFDFEFDSLSNQDELEGFTHALSKDGLWWYQPVLVKKTDNTFVTPTTWDSGWENHKTHELHLDVYTRTMTEQVFSYVSREFVCDISPNHEDINDTVESRALSGIDVYGARPNADSHYVAYINPMRVDVHTSYSGYSVAVVVQSVTGVSYNSPQQSRPALYRFKNENVVDDNDHALNTRLPSKLIAVTGDNPLLPNQDIESDLIGADNVTLSNPNVDDYAIRPYYITFSHGWENDSYFMATTARDVNSWVYRNKQFTGEAGSYNGRHKNFDYKIFMSPLIDHRNLMNGKYQSISMSPDGSILTYPMTSNPDYMDRIDQVFHTNLLSNNSNISFHTTDGYIKSDLPSASGNTFMKDYTVNIDYAPFDTTWKKNWKTNNALYTNTEPSANIIMDYGNGAYRLTQHMINSIPNATPTIYENYYDFPRENVSLSGTGQKSQRMQHIAISYDLNVVCYGVSYGVERLGDGTASTHDDYDRLYFTGRTFRNSEEVNNFNSEVNLDKQRGGVRKLSMSHDGRVAIVTYQMMFGRPEHRNEDDKIHTQVIFIKEREVV